MTDIKNAIPATLEPEPVIEPLFEVNGFPVFGAISVTVEKIIKAGNPIFFLLGNKKVKEEKANTYTTRPALFRVIDNVFGHSVNEVPFSTLGISGEVSTKGFMKLPQISWNLVNKMDFFFREIHKIHNSESIVMLTYDISQLDSIDSSSGWDIYIPTQENDSTACDYKMDEILSHLEENPTLILAGSAHSHPEMPAYFSGTDHKDQADFEGIHITYGWAKNGPTEYHIEMIHNGTAWTYEPEDVFEPFQYPVVEIENFDEIKKKVSKQAPKVITGYGSGGVYNSNTSWKGGKTDPKAPLANTGPMKTGPSIRLPQNAPDVRKNTIVAIMEEDDTKCAFCTAPITQLSSSHHRCYACNGFFMMPDMTLIDLVKTRTENLCPESALIDPSKTDIPIVLWCKKDNPKNSEKKLDVFEEVYSPASKDATEKK